MLRRSIKIPETLGETPLIVRRVKRARNYTLSYNYVKNSALLTIPLRASLASGLKFANSRIEWLDKVKEKFPTKEKFVSGVKLIVLGETMVFVQEEGRSNIVEEYGKVKITCHAEFFDRRVHDYLNKKLRKTLEKEVEIFLAQLRYDNPVRISVKNMSSRWGSCSTSGTLAFSSRLVFATAQAVRYLCAHECAHLIHHNHSKKFWALVKELYPEYQTAQKWLKENGGRLNKFVPKQ